MKNIRSWFSNQKQTDLLIPVLLYSLFVGVSTTLGFDSFNLSWSLWQLLDKQALMHDPLRSLFLLHAQPPFFNYLTAVILRSSSIFGGSPGHWAYGFFILLGLVTSVLFYKTLRSLTGSQLTAALGVALYFLNPSTWYFSHTYFYPFLLSSFLIILLHLAERFLHSTQHQDMYLLGVAATLALIINTRALYHPIWGLAIFGLLVGWRLLYKNTDRKINKPALIGITALLIVFLFLWPLKNLLLFDQFTFSTWTGFNLTRRTNTASKKIEDFWFDGYVPDSVSRKLEAFKKEHHVKDVQVLEEITKTNGGGNWNHFLFVVVNKELTQKGIQYRLQHTTWWRNMSFSHYLRWSQPGFVNPYTQETLGPDQPVYQKLTSKIKSSLFYDLRSQITQLGPRAKYWMERTIIEEDNEPVSFSIFGLFLFPFFLTTSSVLILSTFLNGNTRRGILYLTALWTILWVLVIPCLTDGFESNRMRYAVYPYMILFLTLMVAGRDRSDGKNQTGQKEKEDS